MINENLNVVYEPFIPGVTFDSRPIENLGQNVSGINRNIFPKAPFSEVKWRLENILVEAKRSLDVLTLHNRIVGKQHLALNKLGMLIIDIKATLASIEEQVQKELTNDNANTI